MKSVIVIVTRGPDHGLGLREMLDMTLVFAAFEFNVTVIFQDEGVLWTELPEFPSGYPISLTGKLKSLDLYDIHEVIIHNESLHKFPFVTPRLPAKIETTSSINLKCHSVDLILEA